MDHKIRHCPSTATNEGNSLRMAQSYNSLGPSGSVTNAPKKSRFYALQTRGEQEGSFDVVIDPIKGGVMGYNGLESSLVTEVNIKQCLDLTLVELKDEKGKLSPRYVGSYESLRCVSKVAYELELPNGLASVHPVFHVSMLKKYVGDPTSIFPLEGLGVDENLSFEEVPLEILDQQVRKLKSKEVCFSEIIREELFS
ncbi:hypothetical protein MTR67_012109 [Solanum verrucosum]|uniref:Tf2-1-like SH3-like domain-containing protein n=1 Tax=Solanum verrucosum TaxID=315347 RepID=A0AAF0QF48_SOLVR|nr:hypothetical protein MTR67_012109 [Solanum verrucosum]